MPPPRDPIGAVTHPDPYPYYARLVADRPLANDAGLGLWVAASAAAVTAVLSDDRCRVRPSAEPVPRALLGSPAADVFRHLVRMTDGDGHGAIKQAVAAALASVDAAQVMAQSDRWAGFLLTEAEPRAPLGRLSTVAFDLSVYVLGGLLGIPPDRLPRTAMWVGDFVRCLAPASSAEQIERGKVAAGHLGNLFRELLAARRAGPADGLLDVLAREARRGGPDATDVIVANGIGFLSQAYEATAGLIGNTLLALAAYLEVGDAVATEPGLLDQVIVEVLRFDPPIQNTRRFVAREGTVGGQRMQAGDTVLVVLAAANRDPAANPKPERFDIFRQDRRMFSFGTGSHRCPGEALAMTIARARIARVLASGAAPRRLTDAVTYRPSANARIPLWTEPDDTR